MKKRSLSGVTLGITLVLISIAIYSLKAVFVGDMEGTRKFLFNALGMMPLNILLMTFVFSKLIALHNKQSRLKKQEMLVNAFFGEFGNNLLKLIAQLDTNRGELTVCAGTAAHWDGDIETIKTTFENHTPKLKVLPEDFKSVMEALGSKHTFILTLLEHPALVQHERFPNLVWAMFHLEDELRHRESFENLPASDISHLTGDIERVYTNLITQWVDYMVYLKENYPYLYSLAIRTGPFSTAEDAIVR